MSVTFTFGSYVEHPEYGTILQHGMGHRHECPMADTCAEAIAYGPTSCEHAYDVKLECECTRYDVNLSNGNAVMVLERLGLDADFEDGLYGQATPDEFLGRVLVGNVGRDDSGTATAEHRARGGEGARMTDCGVPAGYFEDRFGRLAVLVAEAKDRGLMVVWA